MAAYSKSGTKFDLRTTCVRLAFFLLLFIGAIGMIDLAKGWGGLRIQTARIATGIISVTGVPAARSDELIFLTHRNLLIATECLGLMLLAVFYALILIYPTRLRYQFAGIFIGTPLILCANLFRLSGLAYVSFHLPGAFDCVHTILFPVLMGLIAVGLWGFWIYLLPKDAQSKKI
ncbi:archaeosortase/exosortase family protein [Pontiellaceae bacterium B12219]|nr:archaeosortase/exosortase family protein [Pontiellaceae bacterium B12219]